MLLAGGLRKKGVDIDKPEGYIKLKLRRWWRREISRWTRREVIDSLSASEDDDRDAQRSWEDYDIYDIALTNEGHAA